jgi:hypothetical protein
MTQIDASPDGRPKERPRLVRNHLIEDQERNSGPIGMTPDRNTV